MFDVLRGKREPMSKVDTAWLRMERPTNLMMITGVISFSEMLDVADLKAVLAERFLAFRRFRQRAVETARGAYWEYDKDFDLDWHVRRSALPGASGKIELQELVSQLASTPLDKSKPLWQFHLVENYQGGCALISRVHHCYADGIALVQVLLSLTETVDGAGAFGDPKRHRPPVIGGNVMQRLLQPARVGIEQTWFYSQKMMEKSLEYARDPALVGELAREGTEITKELAHALSLSDDPKTRLRGPLGVSKRVSWADPLPLEEVKVIGKALGCTVNDVLLACAAGALRAYLMDKGEDVDGLTIRATVPVNLRPLEHARDLGNHFGLVFLELPIGLDNPLSRLYQVALNMHHLKTSRQAAVSLGLLAALGLGPSALQGPALELFSRKASTVATNVPGPQSPLFIAGKPIRDMMFWVPQTGSIGMGISILSYDGNVHFGLITDRKCVPVPDEVICRFGSEFEKLVMITLMEDWDAPMTPTNVREMLERCLQDDGISACAPVEEMGAAAPTKRPKLKRRPSR